MDVRLRIWGSINSANFTDKIIQRSTKKEYSASFQPKTNGIGFISNRSGHSQIWLEGQHNVTQLTHIKNEQIKSFIWSKSGNQFAFLTDSTLWLKTLNNPEIPLNLNFKVKDIYQWWQDENSDYLLLNVLIFDETASKEIPKIILLNLTTLKFKQNLRVKIIGRKKYQVIP